MSSQCCKSSEVIDVNEQDTVDYSRFLDIEADVDDDDSWESSEGEVERGTPIVSLRV
jgi:hypothetical protein